MEHIRFRPGRMITRLEARETPGLSLGLVARRDLGRYYLALDLATVTELRGRFSAEELCLVMDACNSPGWDDASWQTLWAEVADAIRLAREGPGETYGDRWGLSRDEEDALVRKLQGLSWAGKLAIADAVERFWREPERGTDELLVELGLVESDRDEKVRK